MCNRYANWGSKEAIRQLMRLLRRELITTPATDNLQGGEYYPDQDAPIVRNAGTREAQLTMARWGFPPIADKKPPITNIRNLKSPWWRDVNREWLLEPEYRCLVPFTAFAEPVRNSTWFSVPDQEIAFFAGIWRPWQGARLKPVPGKTRRARHEDDWELYAFLTTEANDVVRPVHEKAMPVILTDPDEWQTWLGGGVDSLSLQRPLASRKLEIEMNMPHS